MATASQFGTPLTERANLNRPTEEIPFRIFVCGDFSGRASRAAADGPAEIAERRLAAVEFDDFDDVIEAVGPRLRISLGEEAYEFEFREFDDFLPDAIFRQCDRLQDLVDPRDRSGPNQEATTLLRAFYAHPDFRALESCWRGLDWLLRRTHKDKRVKITLWDVTSDELAADLAATDDLTQTATYARLVGNVERDPDAQPWALAIGLWQYDFTPRDADLAGRMARIAARAGAPFLAAVASTAFADDFNPPPDAKAAWEALRALPESAYVGLAGPRFLLRPPYGENYKQPECFNFEEFSGQAGDYLFGSAALAVAALVAQAFAKNGWSCQPGSVLFLEGMPIHSYRNAEDEDVSVSGERRFSSLVSQERADQGFLPLVSFRGRDRVELAKLGSLAGTQLAGLWSDAASGSGKAAEAGFSGGVSTQTLGTEKTSKASAPTSDVDAWVPDKNKRTSRAADPEVDDDLAALLQGDDDDADSDDDSDSDSDSNSDDDSDSESDSDSDDDSDSDSDDHTADDDGDSDEAASEGLDDELAALLGGVDADAEDGDAEEDDATVAADDDDAEQEPDEDMDAELAALLGGSETEESETEEPLDAAAEESDDDELAALLAGDDDDEDKDEDEDEDEDSESDDDSKDADDELAALLAGDDDEADADEAPNDEDGADSDDQEEDDDLKDLEDDLAAEGDDERENADADEDEDKLAAMMDQLNEPAAADSTPARAPSTRERPMATDVEVPAGASGAAGSADDLSALFAAAQAATGYGSSGTAPLIDFFSLLQPIPGDEPAGEGVPFELREQLEQARKEVNPESFRPDDPLRPEEPIRADWPKIIELSQEVLKEHAKNLLVAARLLEGLTKRHGFAGVRDGLHLMRLLVETCWDRVEPALDEDDDMEVRAAPFNWLDDTDRGAVYPVSLRAAPVVIGAGLSLGLLEWSLVQSGKSSLGADAIDRAVAGASRAACQTMADDLKQAAAELRALLASLQRRMAGEAPGLANVRAVIEEARKLADQILQRKGPAEEAAVGASADPAKGDESAGGTSQGGPRLGTREAAYRQLAEAADALARMEPHSPVPFLIQRAVTLGALPFPDLMKELIRDSSVLQEMCRELGIKKPPGQNHDDI